MSSAKPVGKEKTVPRQTTETQPSQQAPGIPRGRVMSIDALRGFDMFWISGGREVFVTVLALCDYWLVQLGMAIPPLPDWLKSQMAHRDWEGFSAWDLIMPLFLFIVGTAMPFSFAKRLEAGQSKRAIYGKVVVRCLILWILGMAVQGNLLQYKWSELRLYSNTLQAIAAGYLIASVVMLNLRPLGQLLVTIGLLVGYCLILTFVPAPGLPAGTLEPKANLALHIDKVILGEHFRDGTTYAWILASMAFGATVLLGVMSGHILASAQSPARKFLWLVLAGLACLGEGWAWGLWFPIIKHLFTSSMVLWACGWSFLLLALFYLVIDVWGLRRWSIFFVVIGMNAIAVYVATHVFRDAFRQVSSALVGNLVPYLPKPSGAALSALTTFAVVWLILYYMYRKRTFIRV